MSAGNTSCMSCGASCTCTATPDRLFRLPERSEAEFVGIFLVPFQPRLFSVDPKPQIVFVPRRNLSCPKAAFRSTREPKHHMGIVVQASPGNKRTHIGGDCLASQSRHKAREIVRMRANVAERPAGTAARRVGAPLSLLLSGFLKRSRKPVLHVFHLHQP